MSKVLAILACLVPSAIAFPAVAQQAQEEVPASAAEVPPAAPAQPPPAASAKQERRWRVAVAAGAGSAYGQGYFFLGAGIGYDVAFGLFVNVDGQWWMGQTPSLGKIAPGLTWYAPIALHPYVGAYYAHWFVSSGLADQNSLGGRVGLSVGSAGPAVVGFGVAYEHLLSCSVDCDSWWPEVSAGVAF